MIRAVNRLLRARDADERRDAHEVREREAVAEVRAIGIPNVAARTATRRSQAAAIASLPPVVAPPIAAIVGLRTD
jgi:hypothetical protein